MPDPQLPNFDEILDSLAAREPAGEEELPAIGAAIRTIRERLPAATNLGETGDERDAFALLDELTRAVADAYPGGSCRAGCSGCCDSQTAVFDVSPAEWAAIERHVGAEWDTARREQFMARFGQEHGPRLWMYRLLAWLRHFEPLADRYFARQPYRCPFLVEGRCSIYAARPLACRMYGYFAIRSRWYQRPAIYGCHLQARHFGQIQNLALPSVNQVAAQSKRLTRGLARILPLWIARRWSHGACL